MYLVRAVFLVLCRLGLRGRICLAAGVFIVAHGVVVTSVSRSAHDESTTCCRGAAADAAAARFNQADESSLHWFDAVLGEQPEDDSAPTWWDLLLCESAQ